MTLKLLSLSLALFTLSSQALELESRIINGETVLEPNANSAHLVLRDSNQQPLGSCSGTLIAPQWVLTAAHCLEPINQTNVTEALVKVGNTRSVDGLDRTGYQSVTKFYSHPNYQSDLAKNDIALLYLPNPVTNAVVAKLGDATVHSQLVHDTTVLARGFGTTKANEFHYVAPLQEVDLQIIDKTTCLQQFETALSLSLGDQLNERICTSSTNKAICSGDSGGSLFYEVNDERFLVGIISLSPIPCDSGKVPAAFTDVLAYKDWIKSVSGIEVVGIGQGETIRADVIPTTPPEVEKSQHGNNSSGGGSFGVWGLLLLAAFAGSAAARHRR